MREKRQCNGCKACCFTHNVTSATIHGPTIVTELMQHCRYECPTGCRIYAKRPPACQDYACAWLKGEIDGKRPDEFGLVVDFSELKGVKFISAMEAWPGGARTKHAKRFIRESSVDNIVCVFLADKTLKLYVPGGRENDSQKLVELIQSSKRSGII